LGIAKSLDISIRVSRVGKRDADRLYTVDNQRDACTALITAKGYAVGETVEEVNVSGGKRAKDRGVERLIKRIESGESAGIVVFDFSRLTREDAFSAGMLVGRIVNAGGVVYGVADNFDSSAPMAAVMTALYAEQASAYLKTCRERSASGKQAAKERGAYVGRTPPGYDRESGRLVVNGRASIIVEIFSRKLAGESYAELARFATARGMTITVGGIQSILGNPVYTGRSNLGDSPAIIDVETFTRVQAMTHRRKATGAGAKTLAQGLAKCANCGSTLIVNKKSKRSHRTDACYVYCRGHSAGGCDSRAYLSTTKLDAFLESNFLAAFDGNGPLARAYSDQAALIETGKYRDEAMFELAQLKASTALVSTLGITAFEEMINGAVAKVALADRAYNDAKANADTLSGVASMLAQWSTLDLTHRRRLVSSAVESVEVGAGKVSVEAKARVIFRGRVAIENPDNSRAGLAVVA